MHRWARKLLSESISSTLESVHQNNIERFQEVASHRSSAYSAAVRSWAALGIVTMIVGVAAGCDSKAQAANSTEQSVPTLAPEPQPKAPYEVKDPSYTVNFDGTPSCVPGKECSVVLRLTALGKFHVNREYPHKFVGDKADGAEFKPSDPLVIDSQNPKVGTMAIRFTMKNLVDPTGEFRFAVCTDQACQPTKVKIAIPVVRPPAGK